jgi:hypothetical protein
MFYDALMARKLFMLGPPLELSLIYTSGPAEICPGCLAGREHSYNTHTLSIIVGLMALGTPWHNQVGQPNGRVLGKTELIFFKAYVKV